MLRLGSNPPPSHKDHGFDHVLTLLGRLRLDWLSRHFPPKLVQTTYVFINGFITIGLLALLAFITGNPFVFPSLGPTAYLLFFSPLAGASTSRNTILGHAIGLVCGYLAFVCTGAGTVPFAVHTGISGRAFSQLRSRFPQPV